MTAVCLLTAFAIIFAAGAGTTLSLNRSLRFRPFELAALSWLLGSGVLSFGLWLAGLLGLRGFWLQAVVALGACLLLAWGWHRRAPFEKAARESRSWIEWSLGAIILLELALLTLGTYKRTLGWDGIVNWELKARYAFLQGGALPAAYLSDSGRVFTHPEYPLAIPFTELWLYLCLGEAHQFWAKSIFLTYLFAGGTMLYSLGRRCTGRRPIGLLLAALLLVTPQLVTGTGGAVSGYADFPLAIVYLATIGFLTVAATQNDPSAYRFFAAFLALLPWFKREGVILWVVAAGAGIVVTWRAKVPRRLLVFLPGLAVIAAWKIYLFMSHVAPSRDFRALDPALLQEIPRRMPLIFSATLTEMYAIEQWSLLWVIVVLTTAYLALRRREILSAILIWAVWAPLALYVSTYFFSAWPDVVRHVETSWPRLLMHVTPLAWLMIGVALNAIVPLRAPTPGIASCAKEASARNALVDL